MKTGPGFEVQGPGSCTSELRHAGVGVVSHEPVPWMFAPVSVVSDPGPRTPDPGLRSAIYEGSVTHHRVHPVDHRFTYPLYHLYLDLDELDRVFVGTRWWRNASVALAAFRRQDYLPGNLSLADQARALVQERTGQRPDGAVRLLTHTRMFGIAFNPVSFFYCFSAEGSLSAIIAEITNIPWLERCSYVLDCRGRDPHDLVFDLDKRFHISPFMGMRQRYRWRFTVPGEDLAVHMTSMESDQALFSAALAHQRRPLTPSALDALLWRYPFLSLQVVAGIYGQAARLWWKGVPVHDHPALHSPVRQPVRQTAPLIPQGSAHGP